MKRRISRLATVTTATAAVLGTIGASAAHAETPQPCNGKFLCLEDGTQIGAPADTYPDQPDDENVTAAMIVEDCAAAKQAKEGEDPGVDCGFSPYGEPEAVGMGEWKPLTSDYVNCYDDDNFYNLNWSDHNEYLTQNSVTVGRGVNVGLEGVVKASLDINTQATWGHSEGTTQSFATYVPKGYKAHLQHRFQEQVVRGTLWIEYDHDGTGPMESHGRNHWAITDFETTSPVKNENNVVSDQISMSKPTPVAPGECP